MSAGPRRAAADSHSRRRARARPGVLVLLLSLLFSLLCAGEGLAVWPFGSRQHDGSLGERAAAMLSELIRIRTVNPPGHEAAAADWVAARLSSAGIDARTISTPSAPDGGRRAAAWARLPGAGGARPLILLSHLDVVPAEPSEWTHPPFAGQVENGAVHGRGALDAKGVTVIQMLALMELARRETPLRRDVILLATPDEETGGLDGAGYLVRERADLLGDAEYLLTEGGSIRPGHAHLDGRPPAPPMWGVTVTEKSPCWLEVSTRGTPGHGSAPRRDAAVPRLVAALDRIRRVETTVRVLPEVAHMFLALSPNAAPDDRAGFLSLGSALREDPTFRARFLANPSYNALVRNTISITVLEAGPQTNVVPGTARAEIDARLLPGQSCEAFREGLHRVIADPDVVVTPILEFPSRSSPSDSELFSAIGRVAQRHDPDAIVVPRMIGGFTDAHWFREQGIVAYGFVPRWLTAEDTRGVHGANEHISIENLDRGARTLIEIIEELSGTP